MRKAFWTKGDKVRTGSYDYYWPGDFFRVWYGPGERYFRRIYGDSPEWDGWKLADEHPTAGAA